MGKEIVLAANPGAASRKYALYGSGERLAKVHFGLEDGQVIYSLNDQKSEPAGISHLTFAASKLPGLLEEVNKTIVRIIGLAIAVPDDFFHEDHLLDKAIQKRLSDLEPKDPDRIHNLLQEIHQLEKAFPEAILVGVSDSAFHRSQKYALPPHEQHMAKVWRLGYHGLSSESIVEQLREAKKLPEKLIVCHLGSSSSVIAVKNGRSLDSTLTFAAPADICMLIASKASDIELDSYVYKISRAVETMAGALGGADSLVFTGTIGERSPRVRGLVIKDLSTMALTLDEKLNGKAGTQKLARISPAGHRPKVFVAPAEEEAIIVKRAAQLLRHSLVK